jgi:hypothetical protein
MCKFVTLILPRELLGSDQDLFINDPLPSRPLTHSINPCSVFVNGRSRPVVMADMRKRIERGDLQQEKQDAITVCLNGMELYWSPFRITG